MALNEATPIDGDGIETGTKVDEICGAIRQLKIDINNGLIYTGDSRVKRHIRVAAPSWKIGAVGPTPGYVGIVPVLAFDQSSDDSVHYSMFIPYRFEAGSVIDVEVDWCHETAEAGTVCWALEYIGLAAGEAVDGATTTISKVSAGSHANGVMVRNTLTTGILGAVAHDVKGLRLYRDVSEDSLAADAKLIQVHFEFTMDKLGLAV